MIEFFENFNESAFEVAELIFDFCGLCFPFFFTVCLFGFFAIGGIGCLIDWIKERKSAQKKQQVRS